MLWCSSIISSSISSESSSRYPDASPECVIEARRSESCPVGATELSGPSRASASSSKLVVFYSTVSLILLVSLTGVLLESSWFSLPSFLLTLSSSALFFIWSIISAVVSFLPLSCCMLIKSGKLATSCASVEFYFPTALELTLTCED